MLTELTLENFKAFGTRATLPLAPITLLFGGNSAGKSSVFHALHLVREVLTRGNLDPDRTEMGGASLDLGGFANLVHRHELDRAVRLGFTLRDLAWPEVAAFDDGRVEADDEATDDGLVPPGIPFHHEGDDDSTRVVLELRWSHVDGRARVTGFEVARGDQPRPALRIEAALDGRDVRLTEVDTWQFGVDPEAPTDRGDPALEAAIASLQLTPRPFDHPWTIAVYGQDQALPARDRPLYFWPPGSADSDDADSRRDDPAVRAFAVQASRWIHGALDGLREALGAMLHLGPVRTLPARLYEAPRSPAPGRWYAGLGAWDALLEADDAFIERVNRWLSGDEGLGTRCLLQQRDVVEIDRDVWERIESLAVDGADPEALRALIGRQTTRRRLRVYDEVHKVEVAPRDLGVGISQVLPVVVAAMQRSYGLVAMEQPELHVHPRVAVGLGDLLAENRGARRFLVETHSEHLLLRLMRRVRETHEGVLAEDDPRALWAEDVSVLHFGLLAGRDEVEVRRLRLHDYGDFLDVWPEGFFEERLVEMLGR